MYILKPSGKYSIGCISPYNIPIRYPPVLMHGVLEKSPFTSMIFPAIKFGDFIHDIAHQNHQTPLKSI